MKYVDWRRVYDELRDELAEHVRRDPSPMDHRRPDGWEERFKAHLQLATRDVSLGSILVRVEVERDRLTLWARVFDGASQSNVEAQLHSLSAKNLRLVARVRERFENWISGFEDEPPHHGIWGNTLS